MTSSTPTRTARSFADLGRFFPARNPVSERPPKAEPVGHGPFIPCVMCGMTLRYSLAVARVIDPGEDYVAGFAHPEGTCKPSAVKAHRAFVAEQTERNIRADEVRRMRAGQDAGTRPRA